jgi:hypothetical protein
MKNSLHISFHLFCWSKRGEMPNIPVKLLFCAPLFYKKIFLYGQIIIQTRTGSR